MTVTKIFAASTGLHPFSINRISFTLAFTIATLVITKLIDAYIFCGFNGNYYTDLPYGISLFAGYCIVPLLGLALNRRPETKLGRCCRAFSITFIITWLVVTWYGTFWFFIFCAITFGDINDHLGHWHPTVAGIDPFDICGNRTYESVRVQFSNAMPTFDVLQRLDFVYKLLAGFGWLLPMAFAAAASCSFLASLEGKREHYLQREDSEAGRPDDNDEAIVWTEGEGEPEEFFSTAELETTDQCSDQPATVGSDSESPVFGIVGDEASADVKSNDSCDNDIELQLFKA